MAQLDSNLDGAWLEYLSSLDSLCMEGGLEESYKQAGILRDGYRRWLIKAIDKADAAIIELRYFIAQAVENGATEDDTLADRLIVKDLDGSLDFFIQEVELLQSAGDDSYNRWFCRPYLDDIEYTVDENVLDIERDSFLSMMSSFEGDGPALTWVREETFVRKEDAQQFVDSIRKRFRGGDHSIEIVKTEIKEGSDHPFVAVVLEADGNWYHRNQLAALRDTHMNNAIGQVVKATTAQEFRKLANITKRYSRDMQVLNAAKTKDGKRRVGIGFNYVRFAKVMNAIADRTKELGISGFKSYTINEFDSERKPVDGDMLDVGCKQGEFLALEMEDDRYNERSLWKEMEGSSKLSPECKIRLLRAGPTGFVPRSWEDILSFAESGRTLLAA
jgi:hypothetical protein